ncbi:MAG: hypothetical protein QM805_23690 [Pseudomonas sp.]
MTYTDSTKNTVKLGGDTYNSTTKTGGTKITNVADGSAPSDAVNYSQLSQTNQNVTNLGDTVNNIYSSGTKYFHANSTGADSRLPAWTPWPSAWARCRRTRTT